MANISKTFQLIVGQEFNKHVTMKDLISANQNKNIDNDLHCNSNEFPNNLFY